MLPTVFRNLRYSVRQLLKTPSFSVTAILSLAFGIGGTVAVFSLVDAILLKPLQFSNEARLVQIWESRPGFGSSQDPVAPPNLLDWKARSHAFEEIGAADGTILAITGNGRPEQAEATQITANLLPLLGVKPLLGRNFRAEEDQPGARPVALISANLWRTRYGSDPHVTEKKIRLDGISRDIVGVMPYGFTFHQSSQIWTPLALTQAQLHDRDAHFLLAYGLLRPKVTREQAARELGGISKQLEREYPTTNTGVTTALVPMRQQLVGKVRPAILVLGVGVLTILLITCANIAGLMIARNTSRERELAIKTALGASGLALFNEQLLESIVLSALGAMGGVLLASALIPVLQSLVPVTLAAWAHPEMNGHALGLAVVTSLLTAIGFALASHRFFALHSGMSLRSGRGAVSSDRRSVRALLVGAQVALATIVLIATSLLGETFWKLVHTDLGFNPRHVLTMRTELPVSDQTPYRTLQARTSFYRRVVESVEQIPGVRAAGYTTFLPLTNGTSTMGIVPEGAPPRRPGQWNDVQVRVVTPDYFRAAGIRLAGGRFLSEHDTQGQELAAVISQTAARKNWGGENPVGRRFHFESVDSMIRIVGVSADVRDVDIRTAPAAEVYLSYSQDLATGYFRTRDLAIRVSGEPSGYVTSVRRAIYAVDPEQPVASVQTLEAIVETQLAPFELEAKLFGWFAAVSLILSSVGIYGLLSYDVARRKREIGLRMALGAQRGRVMGQFAGYGLRLCLAGIAAGAIVSYFLAGVLRSLLYGVAGLDAASRGMAGLVILGVCLFAAYLPARRASRMDPMEALRAE